MAVSATNILSSPVSAAHGARGAAGKDGATKGGDSFADTLASLDDAATGSDPAAVPADATAGAATPNTATPVAAPAADADAEADAATAATPPLAAQAAAQAPFYKEAGKAKADDDAKPVPAKTDPAANDNSATPPQWLPQQQPVTPPPAPPNTAGAAATTPIADATAPQAGNGANAPTPPQPGQVAANDADAGDDAAPTAEDAAQTAATAQTAKTAPKTAAKPSDFKKALDDAKAAPSKTDAAPAGNSAKQADARTDGNTPDNSQGANAQADAAAANQPVTAPHTAQDNAAATAAVANAAPAHATPDPVQATIATATPHAAAETHHAPNLGSLAVDIAARSQSGTKQFDIRLDPPELGRVEVRLSIDATGKAQAHLTADQPQTLDLLQKDAATLTRALRDAGLDVAHDGLNFSLRNQNSHAGQGQNQGQNPGGRAWRGTLNVPAATDPIQSATAYRGVGTTLLDIKV